MARLVADGQQYTVGEVKIKDHLYPYYYVGVGQVLDAKQRPLQIFPVLTISTNTDNGRLLVADSFAVLRFDKTMSDPVSGQW